MITLQRQITPLKREQAVSDYVVLCAQLIILKATSVVAYHAETIYHLRWLMLAPFRVINDFHFILR